MAVRYRRASVGEADVYGDFYDHINTAVHAHDRSGMITAVLAELDQRTGRRPAQPRHMTLTTSGGLRQVNAPDRADRRAVLDLRAHLALTNFGA
ncbi:hypothetical protein ACWEOZ_37355 [Actinoplanes sp. NPDC004185]